MKKMVKKGFSLMELLIVMVILAGLATMIIPNMSSGSEAAKMTSMRNDARNTISLLQAKFIDNQDYSQFIVEGQDFTDSNDDGMSEAALGDGSYLPVSKGNIVRMIAQDCDGGLNNGISIAVANDTVPGKGIFYNSCTNGKIYTNTAGSIFPVGN